VLELSGAGGGLLCGWKTFVKPNGDVASQSIGLQKEYIGSVAKTVRSRGINLSPQSSVTLLSAFASEIQGPWSSPTEVQFDT
jgi:hypothetical protein